MRVVYKQLADESEPISLKIATAAVCAADQGHRLEFQAALGVTKDDIDPNDLEQYAQRAGLRLDTFRQCTQDPTKQHQVLEDMAEARENGLEGSPVFAVNGVRLSGVQPAARMRQLIQIELRGAPAE